MLTPEQAEGPFHVPDRLLRRDITEGRPGVPLTLALTVRSADACRALPGATVEIWHCDAHGAYSGVDAGGSHERSRFLRGGQRTDHRARAVFRTIYPGWYQGRTPHVHGKVHVGGDEVHTGQLYFPDATTQAVHRRAPYASRGRPPMRNADDGIYAQGGRQSTLSLTRSGAGHVGRLSLVVGV